MPDQEVFRGVNIDKSQDRHIETPAFATLFSTPPEPVDTTSAVSVSDRSPADETPGGLSRRREAAAAEVTPATPDAGEAFALAAEPTAQPDQYTGEGEAVVASAGSGQAAGGTAAAGGGSREPLGGAAEVPAEPPRQASWVASTEEPPPGQLGPDFLEPARQEQSPFEDGGGAATAVPETLSFGGSQDAAAAAGVTPRVVENLLVCDRFCPASQQAPPQRPCQARSAPQCCLGLPMPAMLSQTSSRS